MATHRIKDYAKPRKPKPTLNAVEDKKRIDAYNRLLAAYANAKGKTE